MGWFSKKPTSIKMQKDLRKQLDIIANEPEAKLRAAEWIACCHGIYKGFKRLKPQSPDREFFLLTYNASRNGRKSSVATAFKGSLDPAWSAMYITETWTMARLADIDSGDANGVSMAMQMELYQWARDYLGSDKFQSLSNDANKEATPAHFLI